MNNKKSYNLVSAVPKLLKGAKKGKTSYAYHINYGLPYFPLQHLVTDYPTFKKFAHTIPPLYEEYRPNTDAC